MAEFADECRPNEWAQVVGQDRALAALSCIRKRRGTLAGGCYFLSGSSGTGKTTITELVAAEVADDLYTVRSNGTKLDAATLDKLASARTLRPIVGQSWCFIVNECHVLPERQITALLDLTEDLPAWVTVVFTTTSEAKAGLFDEKLDASPLLSRCSEIPLSRRDLCKPFAARLVACCRQAGLLNGHADEYYLPMAERLLKDKRNNLRAALNAAGSGYFAEGGES